jgi:hypothetical protein
MKPILKRLDIYTLSFTVSICFAVWLGTTFMLPEGNILKAYDKEKE